MSPDNNPTEEELAWAAQLKQAAAANDCNIQIDTDEVSDWEYLQHAIVAKSNTRKALQRLQHLQAFKSRYGILGDGSVEEAARDLRTFLQTHPGLYLSLATAANGDQIFCSEYRHFQASRMKTEEAYAVYMRAAFYVLQASQANLTALRSGLVLFMDIEGSLRYRSFTTEARARELYGTAYPIRLKRVVLLQSSPTLRFLYRWMVQPWMSRKVKEILCFPSVTRDQYLLQRQQDDDPNHHKVPANCIPEVWGGQIPTDKFHETILTRLTERYERAATFQL